ncbi:ABC transporter permease [Actinokineospora guangxiensis]|uniref:ABC transporter permease n=1 Tax=Actinokineospora guangxiensis TaxID=1490288 RepID=A0ABW0EU08_9PSEU
MNPADVDSRLAYISFGLAYILGHGAAALSKGADPLLRLPGWLPIVLLAAGIVAGMVLSILASTRAQRGATESRRLAEKLVGTAWATGFIALFLLITGLSAVEPALQEVLWPAGSVLVVGMIYLAEGAVRGNTLHYALGTWLAVVASASLLLGTAGVYGVLAVAGGGAYIVATLLERRRLVAARSG